MDSLLGIIVIIVDISSIRKTIMYLYRSIQPFQSNMEIFHRLYSSPHIMEIVPKNIKKIDISQVIKYLN
jgi:hypothetical protein